MRKVRDYDAELKALNDKARTLKARKVEQLGQLVTATGADALDVETLAGALLEAISVEDTATREAWRAKGRTFFQRRGRKDQGSPDGNRSGTGQDSRSNPAG